MRPACNSPQLTHFCRWPALYLRIFARKESCVRAGAKILRLLSARSARTTSRPCESLCFTAVNSNEFDTANSQIVCIINEALANQYFPDKDPVGRFIVLPYGNIKMEIAGVVDNTKFQGLNQGDFAELYYPQQQSPLFRCPHHLWSFALPGRRSHLSLRCGKSSGDSTGTLPMNHILSMDEVNIHVAR